MSYKKTKAFTLAETLITLGIIGIVAAITIPILYNNYQKHQYIVGLKKAYSTLQNGFKLYMASEGITDLSKTNLFTDENWQDFSYSAVRQNNFDDVIKKYFKVGKVCKNGDSSCDIMGTYLKDSGEFAEFYQDYYNFCTADGMCYCVWLESETNCEPKNASPGNMKGICAYISVDVNGKEPPNKMGRDCHTSFLISSDGTVYPYYGQDYAKYSVYIDNPSSPANWETSSYYWKNDHTQCGTAGSPTITGGTSGYCLARIMEENWEMNY